MSAENVNSNLPFILGLFIGSYLKCPSPNNSPVITSQTFLGIMNLDKNSLSNKVVEKTYLPLYTQLESKYLEMVAR